MEKSETVKLYNLIFPVWLIWMLPPFILVAAVMNLIIDAVVVLLTAKKLRIERFFKKYKINILKVWGFGFLADLIGVGFLFCASLVFTFIDSIFSMFSEIKFFNDIRLNIDYNPFGNIFAFIITVIGIIVAAVFIYRFNSRRSFENTDMTVHEKKKIALVLSIVTAPYLFLVPVGLFDALAQMIM